MPVIKTYDMSSVELINKTYELSEKIREKNKYKDYTIDDIMLIRTSDIYPQDRMIKPMSEACVFNQARWNFIYQGLEKELSEEQLKQLETKEPYYRQTVHFTENGLVSSHAYGNFDGRQYIILETLKNQIDKANFYNLAGQDTFIKGSMYLSDQAIIVIDVSKYEEIKKEYPDIDNFNIVLYKGMSKIDIEKYEQNGGETPEIYTNSQRATVELLLIDLGFIPEIVGGHYLIESPTSNKVVQLNREIASQKGIEANAKHCFTAVYKQDIEIRKKINKLFDKLLLDFIIKYNNIQTKELSFDKYSSYEISLFLLKQIGIDQLISSVQQYNQTMEEMKKQLNFPNSEEIINGNIPDLYNSYLSYEKQTKK